jgi:flagellar biosynthesis/type III secretory pathway protein FliH
MSSTTPTAPPDPPADATPQDIETDIQASRERLASSVDALTAKLDVKGQAKQKARETSEQAKQMARETSEQAKQMARETSEQAKQKARETSERVRSGAQHAYEQTYERARTTSSAALGALAAGVAGLVVLLIAVRRWSSRRS